MRRSPGFTIENGATAEVRSEALPLLTFPSMSRGRRSTSPDLTCLLYLGGAGAHAKKVYEMMITGTLGAPIQERLSLVKKIHEAINSDLLCGGSTYSAENKICHIRKMYSWADSMGISLNDESAQSTYLHWTDHLAHRVRVLKEIKERAAYTIGAGAGQVLDSALGRTTKLVHLTQLIAPVQKKHRKWSTRRETKSGRNI